MRGGGSAAGEGGAARVRLGPSEAIGAAVASALTMLRLRSLRTAQRRAEGVWHKEWPHVAVVTTASLPWLTGTSINPLLRAAYLAKRGHKVKLAVPFLPVEDQRVVYPGGVTFASPALQTAHVWEWLEQRAGLSAAALGGRLAIEFYPARYAEEFGSAIPMGDLTMLFDPETESDVCVLEEPEHLNWFHKGRAWCAAFKLVVGIVHTNYVEYAKTFKDGSRVRTASLYAINRAMCGSYCHKTIKLSDTIQALPRSVTANVHGVRDSFIDVGKAVAALGDDTSGAFSEAARAQGDGLGTGAYFIGKVLWAKGHRRLLDLLAHQKAVEPASPARVLVVGSGPDEAEVRAECTRLGLDSTVKFAPAMDHGSLKLRAFKVLVNPSRSDVICTTTAEALAMGKFVVCEEHPSNAFFAKHFPRNCLTYKDEAGFVRMLGFALANSPPPLTQEEQAVLSWESATDRFLAIAREDSGKMRYQPGILDSATRIVHQGAGAGRVGDLFRQAAGAGPASKQYMVRRKLAKGKGEKLTGMADPSVWFNLEPVAE